MSIINDIVGKLKGMGKEEGDDRGGLIDDDLTTDKVLKGLRRQRRTQLEEGEKEQLKKDIALFNKERTARFMFGMGSMAEEDKLLRGNTIMNDHSSMLKGGHNIMNSGNDVLKNHGSMIGEGGGMLSSKVLKAKIRKVKRSRGLV